MRARLIIIFAVLLIPCTANAQRAFMEAGVTVASFKTIEDAFRINIPGRGVTGISGIYTSFFPSPNIMLTPRVDLGLMSSNIYNSTQFGFDGQLAYLLRSQRENSPYLFGNYTLVTSSQDGSSDSTTGTGLGVGFRGVLGDVFAIRLEGRYQTWRDGDWNEVVVSLGIGAVIR